MPRTSEQAQPAEPAAALVAGECDAASTAPIVFDTSPGGTPEISPQRLRPQSCRVRIVDVREHDELGGVLGVLEGARHVPQRRVAVEALGWNRDEPVVLVCRSGRRSGAVARELQELGFTRVASLTGGMLAWNALGYPTVDGSDLLPATTITDAPMPMRPVTATDIEAHVSDRDRVRWTKAATLMLHGTQACVDGRDAHAIVGTPGGDAGELVLALASAERLSGRPFSSAEIERIFDAYLEAFGHFYMHSDDHAVAALIDRLADDFPREQLPDPHDHAAAARFVHSPPPALRDALLEQIVDPKVVGCGHLRLMLQHPDEYGVRPQLVADVMRTFYRRLWDGHRALDFVVLSGGHEESAVVTVELTREVHSYTRIPLVSPRLQDTEIFVAHPQVARFVRGENAAFLLEQVPLLSAEGIDESSFLTELDALAGQQLEATLDHLAPTLPRYRVVFSGETFEVVGPQTPGAAAGRTRGTK